MSRRWVKMLAVSYAVKTVVLVMLWLLAPEIPRAIMDHARRVFAGEAKAEAATD